MQIWKQMIMQEVAQELQSVRELAEAQKVEMEMLKRQLQGVEMKSDTLEKELGLLRAKEQKSGQQLGKPLPRTKNQAQLSTQRKTLESPTEASEEDERPVASLEENIAPGAHSNSAKNTQKRNYALVAASKPAQAPEHLWTQAVYKSQKTPATKPNIKTEDKGRRILFPRVLGQQKSEGDLMLALNEALQKAGEETRFCKVRYSPSEAVSALLTEKANARSIIPRLSNVLIRAAKTVDHGIVGVEILEHGQRLKVHGMSLERFLGEGSMELLKRKVESSTGIQLKSLLWWLINKNRLREQQETRKRGSAIVITVKGEAEDKKLCALGLRFRRAVKVIERYWDAGPGLICMTCCGIGHQRMRSCGGRPQKCVICASSHKIEDHQCRVAGCLKERGKICIHVIPKCANSMGAHAANSRRCTSRHKAEICARKEKKAKEIQKEKELANNTDNKVGEEEREASPQLDTDMELERKNWVLSPTPAPEYKIDESPNKILENRDYTKDY